MSLGRLNNPLYDERGQFIGNQQPEANMFGSFYMNPMGAIGSGVSSGNVPAVANPLDNRPVGGGKGGGKGGGSPQPNYIASTPRPSMGKGGGKGGGFAPSQNMYGGLGYNAYMGAGGIRPTSVPTQFSGFNQPTPTPRGGIIPLPETNKTLPFTPSPPPAPPAPPAGKGGGLQARNDFINSDNQLNTIRAEQMELERKARQEALNRSYYDQPEEPLGVPQPAQPLGPTRQPAQMVDPGPAQSAINTSGTYQDYLDSFNASIFGPVGRPISEDAFNQKFGGQPQPPLQFGDPGYMPTYNPSIPASRNPYDRSRMSQMDRLNAAYQDRMRSFQDPRRLAMLEAMRNAMPRTTFASPEDEQRLRNELGMPQPQPDSDYQLQQENFLKEQRAIRELAGRPTPSSAIGAGLGAFGLSNFFGGR